MPNGDLPNPYQHGVVVPRWVLNGLWGAIVTLAGGLIWLGAAYTEAKTTSATAAANQSEISALDKWQAAKEQADTDRDIRISAMNDEIHKLSATEANVTAQLEQIKAILQVIQRQQGGRP